MLSQMYYYNHYLKAPRRDTPGKVVDAFHNTICDEIGGDSENAALWGDRVKTPGSRESRERVRTGSSTTSHLGAGCGTGLLVLTAMATICVSSSGAGSHLVGEGSDGRRLLGNDCAPVVSPTAQTAGTVLGWVSAVIYLNSRLPQVDIISVHM